MKRKLRKVKTYVWHYGHECELGKTMCGIPYRGSIHRSNQLEDVTCRSCINVLVSKLKKNKIYQREYGWRR